MQTSELLSSTAEFALRQLETRGVLVPFCKAVSRDGTVFVYTPETNDPEDVSFTRAEEYQRRIVIQEIPERRIVALAFCKEVVLTLSDPDEILSAVRVEIHHSASKSLVYLFPYRIENGRAKTLPYYTRDVEPLVLWSSDEG